jgi:16S rRNA (adenine1518-N6/adenine1519-N6)-dimethyltransferase
MAQSLPYAKKSLGQHWLYDEASLDAMCDAVSIEAGDPVLEIGPGSGSLTVKLLERGAKVTAVEFDVKLAEDLPKNILQNNSPPDGVEPLTKLLEVAQSDILKFDLTHLPQGYKVVANIPYYITSNLLRVLSESANPPTSAALLVQKEVAERAAAGPGDMSLLSISLQYYWEISLGREVPARLFTPPPKVDSQILVLRRRPEHLFPDVDTKLFFRPIKAAFSGKRKTLRNSVSAGLALDKAETEKILQAAGIDPQRRPETLEMSEWHSLAKSLELKS